MIELREVTTAILPKKVRSMPRPYMKELEAK
jgi:hypothetical protein